MSNSIPEAGEKAPDFSAKNQKGETVSLSDFKGKKLVLYFYPKDDTPGCTAEACDLRDNYNRFLDEGYSILGVSPDNEAKHVKFIDKYDLPFDLLADEDHSVSEAYGVWAEKSMYGRKYMGILRTTFIIDENGVISDVIKKVKTKEHASQILQ
jgi:peroxiredoxin Q/BCP